MKLLVLPIWVFVIIIVLIAGFAGCNLSPSELQSIQITGNALVGAELTALEIHPSDADVTYQWMRSSDNNNFDIIDGETEKTYTIRSEDMERYLRLDIIGTGDFTGESVTSNVIGPIEYEIQSIQITGDAVAGVELTVSEIHPADADVTCQWMRSSDNNNFDIIDGETEKTYTICSEEDMGKYLRLDIIGTGNFTGESMSSNVIGPIGFAGGFGTASDPYQIADWHHLSNVRSINRTGHFELVADINQQTCGYAEQVEESSGGWEPIEYPSFIFPEGFGGTFEGNGHTISGLIIDRTDEDNIGLFYRIDSNGIVKDLTLSDVEVAGRNYVGALAGSIVSEGLVKNLTLTDVEVAGRDYVGALAGFNSGSIIDCHVSGIVSGSSQDEHSGEFIGGITGRNNGTITSCVSSVSVSCTFRYVGGIAGINYGSIQSSTNQGDVSGEDYRIGGIAGYNDSGIIEDSYNTGQVEGNTQIGGIIGNSSDNGKVERCYNIGTIIGSLESTRVGKIAGTNNGTFTANYYLSDEEDLGFGSGDDEPGSVEAKSDKEMKLEATFSSWDFTDIWIIDEGISYPELRFMH